MNNFNSFNLTNSMKVEYSNQDYLQKNFYQESNSMENFNNLNEKYSIRSESSHKIVSPLPVKNYSDNEKKNLKHNFSIENEKPFSFLYFYTNTNNIDDLISPRDRNQNENNWKTSQPTLLSEEKFNAFIEENKNENNNNNNLKPIKNEIKNEIDSNELERANNPLSLDSKFRSFCGHVPRGSELGLLSVSPPLFK
ncbi:hypothetical protein M0811_10675 [Anaeramoeba ignava]|uniref:Uncharacterized protein n=1 Tax=Anaeramoeba ignava TaxID=1746090 RepID=A0A9Q0LEW3_ANAIG|nr:hypothetical protein M0811_10675 [Anaeramoeba ignava]